MEKKTMMIIAAIVAIAIIAAAAVLLLNNNGSHDTDESGKMVGKSLKESEFPASDSRLWVYGNANEDDRMDQSDVTALQNMVDGKRAKTQLADANADGTVDSKDVEYLKKILAATSSTKMDVYYVDNYFKVAKVSWPVKTIATSYCSGFYTAETTGLTQKIAMVDSTINTYWSKLNSYAASAEVYGSTETPDYESMIKKKISVYVPGYCDSTADEQSLSKLNPAGIDVMFLNTCDNSGVDITNEYIDRSIIMFGYLLQGDMDLTYKYLQWHDKIVSTVETAASKLTESQKGALVMSRQSPFYTTTGQYSLTGKGNTNMIHADWAGCYVIADHEPLLPKNYNSLPVETILTILKNAYDAGHSTVYWIDNEHDGLRGQYDLDKTVATWEETLTEAVPEMHYLGMAREAGNSPLYVLEMVFYMNVMHPGLISLDFEDEFDYWVENFTLETSKYTANMDIDNFFKDFGTA